MGPYCLPIPEISLTTVFFYSFKLSVGLAFSAVILAILLMYLLIHICTSDEKDSSVSLVGALIASFIASTVQIFKILLWDYTDYPFLKEYRYGSIIFDCARYGLFALSIPIFAGIDFGYLVQRSGPLTPDHVEALVIYAIYFLPLTLHFCIELMRLIQARRIQTDLIDVFGTDEIFSHIENFFATFFTLNLL